MSTNPLRISKYEMQRQIGHGGLGDVWKAFDLQARREVVLKVIHPDLLSDPNFMARFTRANQVLTQLRHPNIVQVNELNIVRPGDTGSAVAYMAMEYIEGLSLADFIRSTSHVGKLPSASDLVYLFSSLCVAVDFAYEQGLVHGNIKPGNILLNRLNTTNMQVGEPVLLDYGTVQLLERQSRNSISPLYCSPEQAAGEPPTIRSDIYSLGIVLYELCTGVQPFRGDNPMAILMQQMKTLPTPPILINPHIPQALSEVILRAIAKDPAARFGMASLFAAAIADAFSMPSTVQPRKTLTLDDIPAITLSNSGPLNHMLGVSTPLPPRASLPGQASTSGPLPLSIPTANANATGVPGGSFPVAKSVPPPPPPPPPPTLIPVTPTLTGMNENRPIQVQMPQPPPPVYSAPLTSAPLPPLALPETPEQKKPKRRRQPVLLFVALLLLLLLIIGASVFGANAWLHSQANKPNSSASTQVFSGAVFFQDDALGRNDTLRIELHNIQAPPDGKSYFAWLQGDGKNPAQNTLPLGPITVTNGQAIQSFPADQNHTNLISFTQGFFVTVEDSNTQPTAPTGKVVLKAEFDAAILPYLKNILYLDPGFPSGLPTQLGIVAGLFETIKSINEKAGSIVDDLQGQQDYGLVWRQASRILELIDGTDNAKKLGDLPANAATELPKPNPTGLISSATQKGYIDTLAMLLDSIKQASQGNTDALQHIQNIQNALTDIGNWVQQLRPLAVKVRAAHSASPDILAAALQLKSIAKDLYTGRINPPDTAPGLTVGSAGAQQAYTECQYLATLTLQQIG